MRLRRLLPLALIVACRPEAPTATPTPEPTGKPMSTPAAPAEPTRELPKVPDDAFAVVNGVALPLAEFHAIYDLKVAKYHARDREIPASADRRYRKSISQRLIYHEVLRQAVEKIGAKPDAAVLERRAKQQRDGIADWTRHLERRGETERSLHEMYVAEEHERLLLAHSGVLIVTPDEIEARYRETQGPAAPPPTPAALAEIREALASRKLHQGRRALKEELLAKSTIIDTIAAALGPEPAKSGRSVTVRAIPVVELAECDDVIRDYMACAEQQADGAARDVLRSAMAELAAAWRDAAAIGETRESTRKSCLMYREQQASVMTAMGCKWRAK